MAYALFFLLIVGIFIAAVIAAGAYVLGPLDAAAEAKKLPLHYTLVDFFALFVQLSIPLAWLTNAARDAGAERTRVQAILVVVCVGVLLVWWGTVRSAASAGIRHPQKRFLMIGVFVPLTYVAALAVVCSPVVLLSALFNQDGKATLISGGIAIISAAVLVVSRRAVKWCLSADAPKAPVNDLWTELK